MLRNIFYLALFIACNAAAAKEKPYRPPRLPDGHVDLQGTWIMNNATPLERSRDMAALVITAEEAERINARDLSKRLDNSIPADPAENQEDRWVRPIHGELRSSLIVDPEDGRIPGNSLFAEKSASALKAILTAFDGPEQRPASERCIVMPNGMTPIQSLSALNLHKIVQTPSNIVIASEANHDSRVVRMGANHLPTTIHSWLGDSIGWWENDTLVVKTTNFSPNSELRQHGQGMLLLSPQAKITERFTLASNDELHYVFTIEDSTYYTQAWTGENVLHRTGERVYEYACHEGNYSLTNALHSARVLDEKTR